MDQYKWININDKTKNKKYISDLYEINNHISQVILGI